MGEDFACEAQYLPGVRTVVHHLSESRFKGSGLPGTGGLQLGQLLRHGGQQLVTQFGLLLQHHHILILHQSSPNF